MGLSLSAGLYPLPGPLPSWVVCLLPLHSNKGERRSCASSRRGSSVGITRSSCAGRRRGGAPSTSRYHEDPRTQPFCGWPLGCGAPSPSAAWLKWVFTLSQSNSSPPIQEVKCTTLALNPACYPDQRPMKNPGPLDFPHSWSLDSEVALKHEQRVRPHISQSLSLLVESLMSEAVSH